MDRRLTECSTGLGHHASQTHVPSTLPRHRAVRNNTDERPKETGEGAVRPGSGKGRDRGEAREGRESPGSAVVLTQLFKKSF